jgi:ankyrin repeat protein
MHPFKKAQTYLYVYGIGLLSLAVSCTCNNNSGSNGKPSVPNHKKPLQQSELTLGEKWIQKAEDKGCKILAAALAKLEKGEAVEINYDILAEAVTLDDADIFNQLIANGARVDIQDGLNHTLLHRAAKDGSIEIAKILIQSLPIEYLNKQDHWGATPIYWAASSNKIEIAKLLLNKNVDVCIQDVSKNMALHAAIKNNMGELSKILIERMSLEALNKKGFYGRTPLHLASQKEDPEIAQKLIDRKVNINVQDDYGNTPLHWASERGRTEIAKNLIDAGADIAIKDEYGRTPLHWASKKGRTAVAQILVSKLSINQLCIADKHGNTPLHTAIQNGGIDIANILVDKNIDLNQQNNEGNSSIHLSILQELTETATVLINKNVDIVMRNEDGDTPLHLASKKGNIEIAEILIEKSLSQGKDIKNIKNKSQNNAYYYAQTEKMRELLDPDNH